MHKKEYEIPLLDIIIFELEDVITASGDYSGINFEDLI